MMGKEMPLLLLPRIPVEMAAGCGITIQRAVLSIRRHAMTTPAISFKFVHGFQTYFVLSWITRQNGAYFELHKIAERNVSK
jgi:hypothetical protein